MQYILSEEEYNHLVNINQAYNADKTKKLQEFCTMVADNLLITESWFDEKVEPYKWGCILTQHDSEHVCDCCPSKSICPNIHKEWSK